MSQCLELPNGVTLLERGWLSSNNVLIVGDRHSSALIDSGYATHATQTVALIESALQGRTLDLLLNTHLHSDHCGGNAALQARYPNLKTFIPPGQAQYVANWDPQALSYTPTGQLCPKFTYNETLRPNTEITLGDKVWQIHAAPGHDPNSVILFEPQTRLLLSADALWANGFGVVFPELDGESAFHEVEQTIDLIESLTPRLVIPGHGPVFSDVEAAIMRARKRLMSFVDCPEKHIRYAAKVLLKFKLLEVQSIEIKALLAWAQSTLLMGHIHQKSGSDSDFQTWAKQLLDELVSAGAARCEQDTVRNL
jgi:glyoxylase-like metal-dependent hydrolase (beta-lactamase superfamily II)